jgi:hypothetical protein
MMKSNGQSAQLDPWLLVEEDQAQSLFGFALRHPRTGGLAWTISTPVVHADLSRGRATTQSGRLYILGARIAPVDLPDLEAQIAFALLAGPYAHSIAKAVLAGLDEGLARRWVGARKVARHLRLPPPPMDYETVTQFLRQHEGDYRRVANSRIGS